MKNIRILALAAALVAAAAVSYFEKKPAVVLAGDPNPWCPGAPGCP